MKSKKDEELIRYLEDAAKECRKLTKEELIAKCVLLESALMTLQDMLAEQAGDQAREVTEGRGGMISPHP